MGEWLVLLYFSVQMLHVVMVWLGLLLDCFYMILTVCLVFGGGCWAPRFFLTFFDHGDEFSGLFWTYVETFFLHHHLWTI